MNDDNVQNRRQTCCIIISILIISNNNNNEKPAPSPPIIRPIILTDDNQCIETDDGEYHGRDIEYGHDDDDVEDVGRRQSISTTCRGVHGCEIEQDLLPDVFGR